MKMKLLVIGSLIASIEAFTEFGNIMPNARNVVVNGVRVVGLGHPDLTIEFADRSNVNPFGANVFDAAAQVGRDPQVLWTAVCDLDSDGDGILNKDELCDPDCNSAGVANVACGEGLELTHPGFPPGEAGNFSPPGQHVAHGVLMIIAWLFLAPFGVLRAVYFKKRPGKPTWFRDHRYALSATVVVTWISFFIMTSFQGTDTIDAAFEAIPNAGDTATGIHVICGVIVLIISVIQPTSGFLRAHLPAKGEAKSKLRLAWEFQHQWTGRLGLILAITAIYTGLPFVFDNGDAVGKLFMSLFVIIGSLSFVYVLFFRAKHMERLHANAENKDVKPFNVKAIHASARESGAPMVESSISLRSINSASIQAGVEKSAEWMKGTMSQVSRSMSKQFNVVKTKMAGKELQEEERLSRVSFAEEDRNGYAVSREQSLESAFEPASPGTLLMPSPSLRTSKRKSKKSSMKELSDEGPQIGKKYQDVNPRFSKSNRQANSARSGNVEPEADPLHDILKPSADFQLKKSQKSNTNAPTAAANATNGFGGIFAKPSNQTSHRFANVTHKPLKETAPINRRVPNTESEEINDGDDLLEVQKAPVVRRGRKYRNTMSTPFSSVKKVTRQMLFSKRKNETAAAPVEVDETDRPFSNLMNFWNKKQG